MNKQAFTFLTLFTLVLMLSVYYVTLPLENPAVETDELLVMEQVEPLTIYQEQLDEKHSDSVKEEEQVLSNSESTLQQKLEALNEIAATEKTAKLEASIQNNLEKISFNGCFVEIETEITRVLCPKKFESKENVIQILSQVYQSIDNDNLVEVSFE